MSQSPIGECRFQGLHIELGRAAALADLTPAAAAFSQYVHQIGGGFAQRSDLLEDDPLIGERKRYGHRYPQCIDGNIEGTVDARSVPCCSR